MTGARGPATVALASTARVALWSTARVADWSTARVADWSTASTSRRSRCLARLALLALVAPVSAAISGCGYGLAHRGGPALQVAAVRNDTAEAEAGGQLASELRNLLHERGRLAADSSGSPSIEVELVSLRSFPSALNFEGAAAFRIEAQVKVRTGGAEETTTTSEDYLAGVDVLGTEANRRAALRRVLRAASRELVERLEVAGRFR